MLMQSGSYTGDGMSTQGVTGVGFEPDVVYVQGSSATTGAFRLSNMTCSDSVEWVGSGAFSTDLIVSLDADGFTVGNNAGVNACGVTFYYMALADNGDGDMDLGTYNGDGMDNRDICVNFSPTFVQTRGDVCGLACCFKTPECTGEATPRWVSGSDLPTNGIQSLGCGSFQVGTNSSVNWVEGTPPYHWYALLDVCGEFETGTYTGNGTSQSLCVGFQPDVVFVKETTGSVPVVRFKDHTCANSIAPTFGNITNGITSFDCSGFSVGNSGAANESCVKYYWMAWKEVAAGGAPNTAIIALLHQHYHQRRFV